MGGLVIAGTANQKKVELSTDYGQTKTHISDIPTDYADTSQLILACVVIVNKTTLFMAGGYGSSDHQVALRATYFLNMDTKQWTKGPRMDQRHEHTCNLITEPFPQIIIVAGHPSVNTVQIL